MADHAQSRQTSPPEPGLEELQHLVGFLESGSVTEAARRLGLEQPTLSRKLAVFKRPGRDGEAVLERRGGLLELTPKGAQALPAIRDLVRQYDQLLQYLDGANPSTQVVRIAAGQGGLRHYLPRVLATIARQQPLCEIQAVLRRGRERIIEVCRGEIDLAVVTHDPPQISDIAAELPHAQFDLKVIALSSQPFCIVASRRVAEFSALDELPVAGRMRDTALSRFPLVGLDARSGIRRALETRLARSGKSLTFVRGTGAGGWLAAKECARQGLGAALLPVAELHPDDARDLIVRRLPEAIAVQDYLIHMPGELSEAKQAVCAALIHAAGEHVKTSRRLWKEIRKAQE